MELGIAELRVGKEMDVSIVRGLPDTFVSMSGSWSCGGP